VGPRGYVVLLGGLVGLTGYTLAWYGALFVRGAAGPGRPQGPGLLDLIRPSKLAKVEAGLAAPASRDSALQQGLAPGSEVVGNGAIRPAQPAPDANKNALNTIFGPPAGTYTAPNPVPTPWGSAIFGTAAGQ
jgi:hypothetical protein